MIIYRNNNNTVRGTLILYYIIIIRQNPVLYYIMANTTRERIGSPRDPSCPARSRLRKGETKGSGHLGPNCQVETEFLGRLGAARCSGRGHHSVSR